MPSAATTPQRRADVAPIRRTAAASILFLLFCAVLLAGCATRSSGRSDGDPGARIAHHAVGEIGRRYRYGGETRAGFDCSGLALYVHGLEGFAIPRTAAAQFASGAHVARDALRAGDLVFFRFEGAGIDHVGVYIGDGEFVHAPGTGSTVRRTRMDASWFARRYAGAARWWRDAIAP